MGLFAKKPKRLRLQACTLEVRRVPLQTIEDKKLGTSVTQFKTEVRRLEPRPGEQELRHRYGSYGPVVVVAGELELRCPICDCPTVVFEDVLEKMSGARCFRCSRCVCGEGPTAGTWTRFLVTEADAAAPAPATEKA